MFPVGNPKGDHKDLFVDEINEDGSHDHRQGAEAQTRILQPELCVASIVGSLGTYCKNVGPTPKMRDRGPRPLDPQPECLALEGMCSLYNVSSASKWVTMQPGALEGRGIHPRDRMHLQNRMSTLYPKKGILTQHGRETPTGTELGSSFPNIRAPRIHPV